MDNTNSLVSFLINDVLNVDPTLIAKTSGALEFVNNAIQVVDDILAGNIAETLTDLQITVNDLNTLAIDQSTVSTLVNPAAVAITSNSSSPAFARSAANAVYSIAASQPNDISILPIGIEPPPSHKGVYPYLKTSKSESGHISEVDDTPGNERLFEYHRTGTYTEIKPDGNRVLKVVGDNYTVTVHDDHVYVEGTSNLYVKGNINITCLNDASINIAGRTEIVSGGDFRVKAKSISMESVSGDINFYSANGINQTSVADQNILGQNLNVQAKANSNILGVNQNIQSTASLNILSANTKLSSAGNMDIKSSSAFSIESGAALNMKASGDMILSSGGKASLKGSGVASLDGSASLVGNGVSSSASSASLATGANAAIIAQKTGLPGAPDKGGNVPSIPEEIIQGVDDDGAMVQKALSDAVASGRISQSDVDDMKKVEHTADETDSSKAGSVKPLSTYTKGLENLPDTAISGELQLSKSFRLCHLSSPSPCFPQAIRAQGGRTKARIAANMSLLAQNVLEPIQEKFGPIRINSGFRQGAGGSQHLKGMAVDITYGSRSTDPQAMYEIAQWIKQHVAFDQLILEYGNSQIWTHVSYNGEGPQRGQILTCKNPASGKYDAGLMKISSWKPKA